MAQSSTSSGTAVTPASANAFTWDDLYNRVGVFMTGATPTGDDITTAKAIVEGAMLLFYQQRDWTFLNPSATLSVTADDTETDLPAAFEAIVDPFTFAADAGRTLPIVESTPAQILNWRAGTSSSGDPRYFAIRPKALTATTGQRHEAMWYPTVSTDLTLHYRYRVHAGAFTADNEYPYGGQRHSMTILEACLAEAESRKGQPGGEHNTRFWGPKYPEQIGGLLLISMRRDDEMRPSNLGYCGDPSSTRALGRKLMNAIEINP